MEPNNIKKYFFTSEPEYLLSAINVRPFNREDKNAAVLFLFVMFSYTTSLYIGMVEVLKNPHVHDYFEHEVN